MDRPTVADGILKERLFACRFCRHRHLDGNNIEYGRKARARL
jgi:hypothetical protein